MSNKNITRASLCRFCRHLAAAWNFKPEIDVVSSATMTSAINFNSLAQRESLLHELKQSNYLTGGKK